MSIELIFLGLVAFAFLLSVGNWKVGLYAAVVLDVLRDPARKLVDGYPPTITVAVAIVWFGIFIGAIQQNRRDVLAVLRFFPKLSVATRLFIIGLIPGALLSVVTYSGGWRIAAIGGASYAGPLLGFAIGFALAGDQRELYRFIGFFTVVNSIALIGTLAEYHGMNWPILGGMNFDWIRHKPGVIIRLNSGIYRSPDIMGIHAAHVCMFSAMLSVQPRSKSRWIWISLAAWGAVCLVLGGRRKSIGMPLVFLTSYYLIGVWRRAIRSRRFFQLVVAGGLIVGLVYMLQQEVEVSQEYVDYSTTLFTEGAQRSNELIVGSVIHTLYQSGVFGSGLGTATQGRQHVMLGSGVRAWQEDGASRLFMELGIAGVVLVGLAAVLFLQTSIVAFHHVPPNHSLALAQIGVAAVVLANLASFLISHQQYSGDPSFGVMVLMLVGFVLSCPLAKELGWYDPSPRPRGRRGPLSPRSQEPAHRMLSDNANA